MIFTLGYLGSSFARSIARVGPLAHFYTELGPSTPTTESLSYAPKAEKFVGLSTTSTDLGNIYEIDQFGNLQELKQIDVSSATLDAYSIKIDSSNNYYLGGRLSGVTCFIQKRNPDNNESWSKSLAAASPSAEGFVDVEIDSLGNIYAVGHAANDSSAAAHDGLVVKYDSDGNVLWQKYLGDNLTTIKATTVGIDSEDNIYVCLSADASRPAIVKLTSEGVIEWQRENNYTQVTAMSEAKLKVDAFDNVYLLFTTTGFSDDESTYVAKYSNGGTLLWQRHISVFATDLYAADFAIDGVGSVYVLSMSSTTKDNTLIKFLDSGTVSWERTLALTPNDSTYSQFKAISIDPFSSFSLFGDLFGGNAISAKLPRDGEKIGQYSVADKTFTYSVASVTIDAPVNLSPTTSYSVSDAALIESDVTTTTTDVTIEYSKKEIT